MISAAIRTALAFARAGASRQLCARHMARAKVAADPSLVASSTRSNELTRSMSWSDTPPSAGARPFRATARGSAAPIGVGFDSARRAQQARRRRQPAPGVTRARSPVESSFAGLSAAHRTPQSRSQSIRSGSSLGIEPISRGAVANGSRTLDVMEQCGRRGVVPCQNLASIATLRTLRRRERAQQAGLPCRWADQRTSEPPRHRVGRIRRRVAPLAL